MHNLLISRPVTINGLNALTLIIVKNPSSLVLERDICKRRIHFIDITHRSLFYFISIAFCYFISYPQLLFAFWESLCLHFSLFSGHGTDYLNLALRDGGVSLTMGLANGKQEMHIKPARVRFDDHQWHKVTVHRRIQEVRIWRGYVMQCYKQCTFQFHCIVLSNLQRRYVISV